MSNSKHQCEVVDNKCTCTDNNYKHENGKTVCADCGNEHQQPHKCEVVDNKCTCTDNKHKYENGKTICVDCNNERKAQY